MVKLLKLIKNNIFKILGFLLFLTYLFQLYIGYDIDSKQMFDYGMTLFMFALRWITIVTVGFAVITPFFGGKHFKIWTSILAPVIGILNLIFFKQNIHAWGVRFEEKLNYRVVLFFIEQVLLILIGSDSLFSNIKKKEFKNIKPVKMIFILIGMFATFAYQSMFNILLGDFGGKTLDFSPIHIVFLSFNLILVLFGFIFMRKRSMEEKKLFFAALSCSGVFNFFYIPYGGVGSLPFHLCNMAIIMMFMAFIFNMKGIFYFTYFVNVLGALFAMLMPNVTTDAFSLSSIRFWYNHIYAFSVPLLGVLMNVYEKPNLKMMFKAIFWFTVYFLLAVVLNAWLSNYGETDYFFINSNFLFEKLNIKTTIKDNYSYQFSYKNLTFQVYPFFYLAVYAVYIGLMFSVWYIYDSIGRISKSHMELRAKKKIIKEGYIDLRKLLNGRSISDPIYEEAKNMIEIKNFTKIYSGSTKPSVDNLSITIPDGTIYGFLGHNGAGKSTTIKSIVGIQTITSGQIIVDGFDVTKQPVEAKLRIGYVSDNHAVYEKLTGREYINYIADLYMVSQEDRDQRIKKYCEMFALTDAIDREIKSYSHGMKQKIVVIASLIHDPKVWILDEPLTGLDPTSSYQIKECMKEHARRGNIVFFSSHVIEVVEKVCDKICIINHGTIKCEYTLQELKEQGISLEELYLKYVEGC